MENNFDVLTMGRIGVDIYPQQVGLGLAEVESFGKYLGGTATNVAVAGARLGHRTAVISRTGADPFGEFIHRELRAFGVDDRWVTEVSEYPTPVTFCELFPPDRFPLYFYRYPKAPDLTVDAAELDLDAIAAARVFWMTGTGLAEEPSRSATLAALRYRARRGITVFDLDWRPMFWAERGQARRFYQQALEHTTVAVGNLDEVECAVGTRDPERAADRLLEAGVELAVIKQGSDGVLARGRAEVAMAPPVPVDVMNGLGAGDAFGGAMCHGLLSDWSIERTIRFANAAGALVASRIACSSAMPYATEVEDLLAQALPNPSTR